MDNDKTLEHLLQIEATAGALVNDAQAEADRRIHDNEEKNRCAFEERFKAEAELREASLKKEKEKLRQQYQKALDDYREEISNINADMESFSSLFNAFIGEG